MANHKLVTWTLDQIAQQFSTAAVETDAPVLVDGDDGTVYEIEPGLNPVGDAHVGTAAVGTATVGETLGGRSPVGRQITIDLADVVSVTVDPTPTRDEEPIGTEYNLRVEDSVSLLIEGAHADEFGQIDEPETFQNLVTEIKRALLEGRTNPPSADSGFQASYHTVTPANAGRPPENNATDYFAYSIDLQFRGFQTL